ncbi:SDR family oxidoreductase [Nodosilinea sp. P-1105]|nr:SDR family oxidoreductase [Nodosilinea sp. P-1105]
MYFTRDGRLLLPILTNKHPPQAANLSTVDHQQHPVGRVGQPQDIAEMTHFLLSDKAGFITGQNVVIDDGMT